MKKIFAVVALVGFWVAGLAQQPVDLRLNTEYGFTDVDGNENIIVNLPGKSAHEIYEMMSVNIGWLYYDPANMTYRVEDRLITVNAHTRDFCYMNDEFGVYKADYRLYFLIKDEKVLFNISVWNIKPISDSKGYKGSESYSLPEFISKYWYEKGVGFKTSEAASMEVCEKNMSRNVNRILGMYSVPVLPEGW